MISCQIPKNGCDCLQDSIFVRVFSYNKEYQLKHSQVSDICSGGHNVSWLLFEWSQGGFYLYITCTSVSVNYILGS